MKDFSNKAEKQTDDPIYQQGFRCLHDQFSHHFAIRYIWPQPKNSYWRISEVSSQLKRGINNSIPTQRTMQNTFSRRFNSALRFVKETDKLPFPVGFKYLF